MRKAYIIKTALILMSNKLKRTLLLLALNIVCFLLFLLGLFLYEQQNYNRNSCEKLLSSGIEGTGYLVIENNFFDRDYEKKKENYGKHFISMMGLLQLALSVQAVCHICLSFRSCRENMTIREIHGHITTEEIFV